MNVPLKHLSCLIENLFIQNRRIWAVDRETYDAYVKAMYREGWQYNIFQGRKNWPHLPYFIFEFNGIVYEIDCLETWDASISGDALG